MRKNSAIDSISKEMILQEVAAVKIMEQICNKQDYNFDEFILLQKKKAKLHALFGLKTPNFSFCRNLFPEINNLLLKRKEKFSIFYFFVYFHLYFIAKILLRMYKKFYAF